MQYFPKKTKMVCLCVDDFRIKYPSTILNTLGEKIILLLIRNITTFVVYPSTVTMRRVMLMWQCQVMLPIH